MKRLIALITMAVFVVPAYAQSASDTLERTLVSGDKAIMAFPPQLVAGPTVRRIVPSSSGKRILIEREVSSLTPQVLAQVVANPGKPPSGPISETVLSLWNQDTAKSEELWRGQQGEVQLYEMTWLGSGESAVIMTSEKALPVKAGDPPRQILALYRVLASGGRPKKLTELADGAYVIITPHPTRSQALLQITNTPREPVAAGQPFRASQGVSFLLANGVITPPVEIPNGVTLNSAYWHGDNVILNLSVPPAKQGDKEQRKYASLAVGSTKITLLDQRPMINREFVTRPKTDEGPIFLNQDPVIVKSGDASLMIRPLWLVGKEPSEKQRALISRSVESGWLTPDRDAIFYKSEGALWSVAIGSMPKEMFLEARAAAERATLLSNAKQVALAALMCAQDYDEVMPGSGDFPGKLMPYLKNEELTRNFVFTFAGGPLSGIDKPAETELGHVLGPGGRAVVYVDGHAKWIKDK